MDRLSAGENLMLRSDEVWPQEIGALGTLDGRNLRDPDGRFRIEAVREAVAGRLPLVPQFRQLLYLPPPRLGGPLWVHAPSFDLTNHIAVRVLPPPGDEAQLLAAVERIRRRRLDRSRPLWEMWFLTGLPEARVGLFVRMHHTIGDGRAAVAIMAMFLDTTPDAAPAPPRPWTPAPVPTETELLQDKRQRRARQVRGILSRLAHPVTTAGRVLATWPWIRELLAERALPATTLDRPVGADRRLALIRSDLAFVKGVARAYQAKVNDVLLAAIAGGLRELLAGRAAAVDGAAVRIYVPVSLRQQPRAPAQGNLIAPMVVPLPVGVSDPVRRLRMIAKETARRKARPRPWLDMVPSRGIAGRAFLKLVRRQRVNVTSANIPGPEAPLYLAGARLLEVFPMVQLIGRVSLAVGAMSYAGQFSIMIVADRDAYPDLDIFANSMQDELHALARPLAVRANLAWWTGSAGDPAAARRAGHR
jgi:WS/DGAT/MGAT family acyltransferase